MKKKLQLLLKWYHDLGIDSRSLLLYTIFLLSFTERKLFYIIIGGPGTLEKDGILTSWYIFFESFKLNID